VLALDHLPWPLAQELLSVFKLAATAAVAYHLPAAEALMMVNAYTPGTPTSPTTIRNTSQAISDNAISKRMNCT
jgi:hypothetical protein